MGTRWLVFVLAATLVLGDGDTVDLAGSEDDETCAEGDETCAGAQPATVHDGAAWILSDDDSPPADAEAACIKYFGNGKPSVPMDQIQKVQKMLLTEAERRDGALTAAMRAKCNGRSIFLVGNPCRKGCPAKTPHRDKKTGECSAEEDAGATQRCDKKAMAAMGLEEQVLQMKCWVGGDIEVTFSAQIAELEPDWAAQVRAIYEQHNPSKVGTVPKLLAKYAGRERTLVAKLKVKNEAAAADEAAAARAVAAAAASGEDTAALDERWGAMASDNKCEVCKFLADEAVLAVERSIMAQKSQQAAAWTGPKPFNWGDLKMKLYPRPAVRDMCVRENLEAYFGAYVGTWERTAAVETTVDDAMAGCRALVQKPSGKAVFEALVGAYARNPISMPLSYVAEKMPDKQIPKGNLKMRTEQDYPAVCVEAAQLCTEEETQPVYGKARKTAPATPVPGASSD